MGRRDYPDAEKIAKRAGKLRDGSGTQRDLNTKSVDQYTQAHLIEAQKRDAKAIGAATVGNMVDKRVNIEGARPTAKVMARGGQEAEKHASDILEPWGNTMPWLAQGDFPVWDTMVQSQQLLGGAWSKVLPAPQYYNDSEYVELIEEWNRLVDEGKDTEDIREKVRVYRRDHPAIAWVYVDARDVFMDRDEKPGPAGVYEFRKMTREDIESRWPKVALEDKKEEFDVIEYANDVYVASILKGGGGVAGIGKRPDGFLGDPWEHGMGCNPYVRILRGPLLANTQGYTMTGCAFHARALSDTIDESLTNWGEGMRREIKSPLVYTLIPQIRTLLGLEDKKIEPDEKGNITLYANKEHGVEGVGRGPTPTVNEQLPGFIALVGNQADRSGAWVPQLTGYGPSGESAVHQAGARQSAITGELEVPHRNLEQGFADVVERCFRCVTALDKTLPEGASPEMRKVVVRQPVSKHGSKEIAVTADDVKNYEPMVRGKIAQNLPVNEGLLAQTAVYLTNPEHPLIDDNTARERFLSIENPQEIADKIEEQRLVRKGIDTYMEEWAQRLKIAADEISDAEMAKIMEDIREGNVSPDAGQALIAELSGEGENAMIGDLARSQANMARTGRGQRMSNLQGLGAIPPEEMP